MLYPLYCNSFFVYSLTVSKESDSTTITREAQLAEDVHKLLKEISSSKYDCVIY